MGSQQIPLVESGDFGYIENLNQGAYGLTYLEAEVERAVHRIFREIDHQGGVLPAIENEYFRTAIQDEVQRERSAMRDGKRRVVGVNYLTSRDGARPRGELVHIPVKSKRAQAARTRAFKREHATDGRRRTRTPAGLQPSPTPTSSRRCSTPSSTHTSARVTHALWKSGPLQAEYVGRRT